ncbi:unnamed protein product [Heterobilharzia americana]|nr:unnamed protein product [Heterobilharzia americana]
MCLYFTYIQSTKTVFKMNNSPVKQEGSTERAVLNRRENHAFFNEFNKLQKLELWPLRPKIHNYWRLHLEMVI